MLVVAAAVVAIAFLLLPTPALAWGPVTHVALGMQVLATVVTDTHPLCAALEAFPEVFLYGSLAPDIVQGRRLQSRLRRHSHNWTVGLGLLEAASSGEDRAFAYGYLAHLGADVVAHNFFLPARLIGRFDSRLSGHIYYEARFDSIHDASYRELLLSLLDIDFRSVDATLARAVDSPLISFKNHRRIFEGGLKRVRHLHRVITMLGGPRRSIARRPSCFPPLRAKRSQVFSIIAPTRWFVGSIRWASRRCEPRRSRAAICAGWERWALGRALVPGKFLNRWSKNCSVISARRGSTAPPLSSRNDLIDAQLLTEATGLPAAFQPVIPSAITLTSL